MASRIEQYAMIGDTQTAALVGDDGSIDWLCTPRFDSDACFAALGGDENHGRWQIAPAGGGRATRRRYRDGTLVLETEFDTLDGSVNIIGKVRVDASGAVKHEPQERGKKHGEFAPRREQGESLIH